MGTWGHIKSCVNFVDAVFDDLLVYYAASIWSTRDTLHLIVINWGQLMTVEMLYGGLIGPNVTAASAQCVCWLDAPSIMLFLFICL